MDNVSIGEVIALSKAFGGGGGSSGGGVLVVNISKKTDSKYVCDKTTGEMWSALTNGNGLLFYFYYDETYTEIDTLKYAGIDDGEYGFIVDTGGGSSKTFISDSLDAYPETTS